VIGAILDGQIRSDQPDGINFDGDLQGHFREDLLVASLDLFPACGEIRPGEVSDLAILGKELGKSGRVLIVVGHDEVSGGLLEPGDFRDGFFRENVGR
jgi:hypothetical protein